MQRIEEPIKHEAEIPIFPAMPKNRQFSTDASAANAKETRQISHDAMQCADKQHPCNPCPEKSTNKDSADVCNKAPPQTQSPCAANTKSQPSVDEVLGTKECAGDGNAIAVDANVKINDIAGCAVECSTAETLATDRIKEILGDKECVGVGALGDSTDDTCESVCPRMASAKDCCLEEADDPTFVSEMDKMPGLIPWHEKCNETTQRLHLGVGLVFAALSTVAMCAFIKKTFLP